MNDGAVDSIYHSISNSNDMWPVCVTLEASLKIVGCI